MCENKYFRLQTLSNQEKLFPLSCDFSISLNNALSQTEINKEPSLFYAYCKENLHFKKMNK